MQSVSNRTRGWVLLGASIATGTIAAAQETELWTFAPSGTEGRVGEFLLPTVDYDADGWPEVWVSADSSAPSTHCDTWDLYLLSGRTGGVVLQTSLCAHGGPTTAGATLVPDLDGDGLPELVVGLVVFHEHSLFLQESDPVGGTLVLIDGATGSVLRQTTGGSVDRRFGHAVARLDDMNGDGYPEIAVGDPAAADAPGGTAGIVHTWDPVAWASIGTSTSSLPSPTSDATLGFGAALMRLPDIDGDSRADLLIAEPSFGSDSKGRVLRWDSSSGLLGPGWWGLGLFHNFGLSLHEYPDRTGDGRPEVGVVGNFAPGGPSAHSALFVLDPTTVSVVETVLAHDTQSAFWALGSSALLGDLDGDGVSEVAFHGTNLPCYFAPGGSDRLHVLDPASRELRYRGFECSPDDGGWSIATLGDPEGTGRPIVVLGERSPGSEPQDRVVALRIDNPAPLAGAGPATACHGTSIGLSGWWPNLSGLATTLELSGAAPSVPALALISAQAATWFGLPLPLDLGAFGAPGCALAVPPDLVFATTTDPSGDASLDLVPPVGEPELAGLPLFAQWIVAAPLNPLGLATSDALDMVLLP